MQIPKSNVTPMVRTAPVDPKFLMMAAAMMKGEGKLDPKLDPKDVEPQRGLATQSGRPIETGAGTRPPMPGAVVGSSGT